MISLIDRIASSLAGIGISIKSGLQFVSNKQIIGIPNFMHVKSKSLQDYSLYVKQTKLILY